MDCRCYCCKDIKDARKSLPPLQIPEIVPDVIEEEEEEEEVELIDSPINLQESCAVKKRGRLLFKGLSKYPEYILMHNTGDMLLLNFIWPENDPDPPTVTRGVLKDNVFKFHQIYFHWGSSEAIGSDHRINNKQYPGEVHLVFYNSKFNSFADALEFIDTSNNRVRSVLVIAVLFKIDHDAPCRKFTSFIEDVPEPGQYITIVDENCFNIKDIIEVGVWGYFQYNARIVTPFHQNNITWIVANYFATIKRAEIAHFRNLMNNEFEPLVDNFVELHEVGKRKVFLYP